MDQKEKASFHQVGSIPHQDGNRFPEAVNGVLLSLGGNENVAAYKYGLQMILCHDWTNVVISHKHIPDDIHIDEASFTYKSIRALPYVYPKPSDLQCETFLHWRVTVLLQFIRHQISRQLSTSKIRHCRLSTQ